MGEMRLLDSEFFGEDVFRDYHFGGDRDDGRWRPVSVMVDSDGGSSVFESFRADESTEQMCVYWAIAIDRYVYGTSMSSYEYE